MNPSSEDMWTGKRRLKLAQATLEDNDVPSDLDPMICIDLRSPSTSGSSPSTSESLRGDLGDLVPFGDLVAPGDLVPFGDLVAPGDLVAFGAFDDIRRPVKVVAQVSASHAGR